MMVRMTKAITVTLDEQAIKALRSIVIKRQRAARGLLRRVSVSEITREAIIAFAAKEART
jgi:hypothetical protein